MNLKLLIMDEKEAKFNLFLKSGYVHISNAHFEKQTSFGFLND